MSSANYAKHGNTAVITLDNPPVNGLGYELRCGIVAGIDPAITETRLLPVKTQHFINFLREHLGQ